MTSIEAISPAGGPATRRRGAVAAGHVTDRAGQAVGIVALGAVVAGAWYLLFRLEIFSELILPSPVDTAEEFVRIGTDIVQGGFVGERLWNSLQATLGGFAVAALIGVFFGMLVGETRFGARIVMPYLVAINAMPKIAFAPVLVAALGFGVSAKIAMATLIAAFPVIVATTAGIQACRAQELMLFKAILASRWQTLIKLKFPTALPYVFAGLRTSAVYCLLAVIFMEFLGGGDGVGGVIKVSAMQFQTASAFALIGWLSLIGLVLYGLISLAERKIVHWQGPGSTQVA